MSYSRTEYRRSDDERHENKDGGWRSWFGLDGGHKDRDDDRGYYYAKTTTYRDTDRDYPRTGQYTSTYDRPQRQYDQYPSERQPTYGGYGTERGGYGYQTTGEYTSRQQPYWAPSCDRDYMRTHETTTTPRYGETQRYGGDMTHRRETTERSPSRGYGYSGDYNTSRTQEYPRGGDYSNRQSTYTTGGDRDRSYGYGDNYPTSRSYGGYSGDYNRPTGGYSTSYRY